MNDFETMQETLNGMVPAEMAGAVNMLAHPVAGAAAMSALGYGLFSHVLGAWMGAMNGAAEASQRLLRPAATNMPVVNTARAFDSTLDKARARAKALMEKAQAEARAAAEASPAAMPAATAHHLWQPKSLTRPDVPDDLKAISGIGPKLEAVLNGIGIWSYRQIAAWTPQEAGWVDEHFGLGGRVGRDGWVEQAAALVRSGQEN
jgi:NADH-quinone oxidoreductase subunit E